MMSHRNILAILATAAYLIVSTPIFGDTDLKAALRRAQYLLNGTLPTDKEFEENAASVKSYRKAVRGFIENENFYNILLRYHERVFGVGLPLEYMDELMREDIDGKLHKFASITCERTEGTNSRFRCFWSSTEEESWKNNGNRSTCPAAWEEAASVFWYPGIVAWVCPSVLKTCGNDLSNCFVSFADSDVARNSELGTTESFDSRFAVIRSLSRQSAGLATAIAVQNIPYTYILEPGLTAVDGAIAHFYRQNHHFKIDQLNLAPSVLDAAKTMPLTDTQFKLIKADGLNLSSGGILTTFGWLRRYDKNRTRANQLYERLLCRKFTSELPRVFPQDPGNLRETEGCSGCHATLDPLADFFSAWGEEGALYLNHSDPVTTSFNGQNGSTVYDLANIIRNDQAFATCNVQHAWNWLMGRTFYTEEDTLRAKLTDYFVNTNYSFKELVYAIATHPDFANGLRSDAVVSDPLEEPPLGQLPGEVEQPCDQVIDYTTDIAPKIDLCTNCHNGSGSRQDLSTEATWQTWGSQAVNMMASGLMPPGQTGPDILDLKESVRCWLEQN
ncbi:MAG: hypothetical protein AB7T49_18440 [Oligoflexales bacterium]